MSTHNEIMQLIKEKNKTRFIEIMNNENVDPTAHNDSYIIEAASVGALDIVKYLIINTNSNPAAKHNKAFVEAASNGYLDVVQYLSKDKRVLVNDQSYGAFFGAFFNEHFDVAEFLIKGEVLTITGLLAEIVEQNDPESADYVLNLMDKIPYFTYRAFFNKFVFHNNQEMIDIFWNKKEIREQLKEQDFECFTLINIEKVKNKVCEF
jgi:hypothetical protein